MPEEKKEGEPTPQVEPTPTPEPIIEPKEAPKPPEGEMISRTELDGIVANAVQAALTANAEKQAEDARIKAAAEQGDYKSLYEDAERQRKTAELNLLRGQTLTKFGLDSDWFDSLQGDTKEKLEESAKALKKRLDKQIEDAKQQMLDDSKGTPPSPKGHLRGGTGGEDDAKTQTRRSLAGAFGRRA